MAAISKKCWLGGTASAAAGICLVAALPVLAGMAVAAEKSPLQPDAVRELGSVRQQIAISRARKAELSAEIGKLEKDRATINKALIAIAAKSREIAKNLRESQGRLTELRKQQSDVRTSLNSRRDVLAEVLGALQRMGTNPPPALLVTPEDALGSVRSAILLGAVVPEIRTETGILLSELNELLRISEDIAREQAVQLASNTALAEEEERHKLALEEKRKLTADMREELANQTALAAKLGARENDIEKLMARMEREFASVRAAAEAARKAEDKRLARERNALEAARKEQPDFSDTGRLEPAMAFEDAKGMLPLPADGVEMHAFGTPDTLGEPSPGISIATSDNSIVSSPADGWVVYSGPFRSYGQLLILNVGNGYHIVLAGMARIDVQLGQFVLAGEPVAMMGDKRLASVEAIGVESAKPVLYVEFRKDGQSIDPSPWWTDATVKRVADDS